MIKTKIIIPNGIDIWPHELKTAQALAKSGFTVKFIQSTKIDHNKSPDVLINGLKWEI